MIILFPIATMLVNSLAVASVLLSVLAAVQGQDIVACPVLNAGTDSVAYVCPPKCAAHTALTLTTTTTVTRTKTIIPPCPTYIAGPITTPVDKRALTPVACPTYILPTITLPCIECLPRPTIVTATATVQTQVTAWLPCPLYPD
ncbi:hypothetical protein FS842_004338 [Serendipita sp. 407]|nr:hypothetical protein FS842_004338 [Serendipita sp. 407]